MASSKVRVGFHGESEKTIGVLVDVVIGPGKHDYSASRLEWFPKSICKIEAIEEKDTIPKYFLTAPDWLLEKKNVSKEVKTIK